MMEVGVIGCRFNHQLGERCLTMWRYLADHYKVKVHIFTTDRWIDKKGDSDLKDTKYLKIHKLFTMGAQYGQFKHAMPSLPFVMMNYPQIKIFYAQEEPIQMGVTWPAYCAAKMLGKPFVFFTWENKFQKWFFPIGAIENQIIKGSDILIAGTEDAKNILIKKGANPKKVVVIPETGIDTDRFRNVKKQAEKTILYIGRLVPEKGINVLLKARDILRKEGKHYKYLFIGEGPLKNKLEKLAKKNADISLMKPCPYEQVNKIYALGNVFFYASLRTKKWEEQYGYSMLEALASGLPVISTKGISGPDAIVKDGETGYLIPEGDAKAAAHRISLLMEYPDTLRYYSKKAREDATTRLSKESVADRTYKLLRDICAKKI